MKIVVLDGHTLNPGDLSWEGLSALGEITVYPRTSSEEILCRAQGAEILLTNKVPLRREHFVQLPQLRFVGVLATGYNLIDLTAARERGITVCNVPQYSTASVAQLVFALLLEITHSVRLHHQKVAEGKWSQSSDFSFCEKPLIELAGKNLGILGYGTIGKAVAQIGQSFGMNILISTRRTPESAIGKLVDFRTLLQESDFLTLHCPSTPETDQIINQKALSLMKPTAYLINTSRGQLIQEKDLAQALHHQQIAGAALDVLSVEPPPESHPLLKAPRCLITPHIGWASLAARQRLMTQTMQNIEAFLKGTPIHVVN
jgi:glycerate dehydrogenase